MVTKRKVTKKKTVKKRASPKSTSTSTKRVATSATKKKGVAAKRKPPVPSGAFVLGEALIISDVLEWREKMAAAISSQDEIILDGGAIEQIDGTGLQLLVALMKEAAASKTTIAWQSASEVLLHGAAQLGLMEILSLDKLSEAD